jgi:hypothetical protein
VDFTELTRVLQTSISPVAMISGIGLLLLSMTNRLGRTTDRARLLSDAIARSTPEEGKRFIIQIRILYRRSQILRLAITLGAISILFVSIQIIMLFAVSTLGWNLQYMVLVLFILSLASLVGSLVFFIQDLTLALQALKYEVGEHLWPAQE